MNNEPLNDFEAVVVRDFIAGFWSVWETHCKDFGIDPNDIYVKVGGERED